MLLTEQDRAALAKAAGFIQGTQDECDRFNAGLPALRRADDDSLIATIQAGAPEDRLNALVVLLGRRNPALATILPALWDDPDDRIAEAAVRHAPDDPGTTERLRGLLDDPRLWAAAAVALAQRKDAAIVPRLVAWFRDGDQDRRNAAFSCLGSYGLLAGDAALALLREAWDIGGRDDADRAMLAVGLLSRGDRAGRDFLVDLARRADDDAACWAAETIFAHDRPLGLDLMLHVLDRGASFRVRWGMVEKVARLGDLPHLWTADGLAEARHWVEQQRLAL